MCSSSRLTHKHNFNDGLKHKYLETNDKGKRFTSRCKKYDLSATLGFYVMSGTCGDRNYMNLMQMVFAVLYERKHNFSYHLRNGSITRQDT
ncbi:CLUMA_CG010747, isoform A [Clunio marinus]|uniref:CLUMA_CG010747, isoform A n=1 Tax=Clunio marinus TaxID=568069 RepID=A0A1J1ICS8_9DIPT|nr:CLUMA_CG010747, isoform A [Clunio marinus]